MANEREREIASSGGSNEGDHQKLARGGELDVDYGGRCLRHLPCVAQLSARPFRKLWTSIPRAPSRASRCAPSQTCRSTGVHPVRRVQETTRLSFGAGCALSLLSHTTPCPPLLRATHRGCFAVLTQCSHYFHLMCITTWLHNKNTCPICRRKWEFASAPKPAPATPGNRGFASGFAVAEAAAPVED